MDVSLVWEQGAELESIIVRSRAAWRLPVPTAFARLLLLEPAHFIIEEGMFAGIRSRAEGAARTA